MNYNYSTFLRFLFLMLLWGSGLASQAASNLTKSKPETEDGKEQLASPTPATPARPKKAMALNSMMAARLNQALSKLSLPKELASSNGKVLGATARESVEMSASADSARGYFKDLDEKNRYFQPDNMSGNELMRLPVGLKYDAGDNTTVELALVSIVVLLKISFFALSMVNWPSVTGGCRNVAVSRYKRLTISDPIRNRGEQGIECTNCRFDVEMIESSSSEWIKYYEFKSFKNPSRVSIKQFKTYLESIGSLRELKYIFAATKISKENAKSEMTIFFKNNAKEIFEIGGPKGFFNNIKTSDGDIINIQSWQQLRTLCEDTNFSKSTLFNFVESL